MLYFIFILFGIFVDDKMIKKDGIKKVSLVKIISILDLVNTAKTGTGSKLVNGPVFWLLIKTNQES